nr:hypothetical protein OH826_34260 [Streptomyces sp. NBC_00899]
MGEARGGDGHPAETGRTEHVQPPHGGWTAPEKPAAAGRREGRLDLNVPQVAGSAVAAVVAAKLASNLGVYGTIVGAGVVSVLGTCGGSILQHFFRRTGRQVQEVAVQARPGVRRIREQAWSRTDAARAADRTDRTDGTDRTDRTRVLPEPEPEPAGTAPPAGFGDGYGEATSYRARRRNWKRPAVAVALAFGLTMGGITAYEAVAGENISGNGHGTTIGNAVTGHDSPHSGGTEPAPSPAPSTGGPQERDSGGRPDPATTPSHPRSTPTPSTGATRPTPTPTPTRTTPEPTPTTPTPTPTPSDGGTGDATPTAPAG